MNLVPTPRTRRLAEHAREKAATGEISAYDIAHRLLPDLTQRDQLAAFVGILLDPRTTPHTATPREHRPDHCRDCGVDLADVARGSRGLCRRCYDHNHCAGTLDRFPKLTRGTGSRRVSS